MSLPKKPDQRLEYVTMSHLTVGSQNSVPLSSADYRSVAESRLPGNGRVRELQAAAAGSSGRRPGDPADSLPHAALHRHGARRLASPLPALQSQPLTDAQQPLRLGTGTAPPCTLTTQNVSTVGFGWFESGKIKVLKFKKQERNFSFPLLGSDQIFKACGCRQEN